MFTICIDRCTWWTKSDMPRNAEFRGLVQLMRLFAQPWIAKSRRLLSSLDELEKEVEADIPCVPFERYEIQSFEMSEERLRYSLNRARQIDVDENEDVQPETHARGSPRQPPAPPLRLATPESDNRSSNGRRSPFEAPQRQARLYLSRGCIEC